MSAELVTAATSKNKQERESQRPRLAGGFTSLLEARLWGPRGKRCPCQEDSEKARVLATPLCCPRLLVKQVKEKDDTGRSRRHCLPPTVGGGAQCPWTMDRQTQWDSVHTVEYYSALTRRRCHLLQRGGTLGDTVLSE